MNAQFSTKKKVLITEKFATEAFVQLQTAGLFDVERLGERSLLDFSETTEILIIRSKTKLSSEILEKFSKLKIIVTCTSGFDHIDLETTEKKNIIVMYTPDANAVAAAELTWSLVLACARPIVEAHRMTKAGTWDRGLLTGTELFGKTYGVVGLGRIGARVARIAQAFGMSVVAFDPYQDDSVFEDLKIERSSYEEILKQSDVISFHVPLTKETKNMMNRSHFEYTNRTVILVNTSRGGIVNEDDLALALEDKLIKAAALDVFAKEPLPRDSRLIKAPNLILTQHMGALTEEAFAKASTEAAQILIQYFKNKTLKNTLPLKNNWGSMMFDS